MSPHSSPERVSLRGGSKTRPRRRRKSSLSSTNNQKLARIEVFTEIVNFFVVDMFPEPIFCSKIAQKCKSCSGLLESQKLGPNAIRCSKVAEHKSRSVQRSSKTRKIGYLCIWEILVVTFSDVTVRPFVHPPVRPHHRRLEVFLAGNRMATRVLWSRYRRKNLNSIPTRISW